MKRIFALFLAVTMAAGIITQAYAVSVTAFPDVGEKNWCYTYVTDLATKGIVTGLPDGNYGPDQQVTRGSLAKLLWEALKFKGYVIPTENATSKLSTSGWSAPYINALVDKGIFVATEYPNGFVEGQPMSRLETTKAVVRAYLMATPTAKLPTGAAASLTFADTVGIPAADHALVSMGVELGIIKGISVGDGKTKFAPADAIQRSTAATIVSRFLEVVGEAVTTPPATDGPKITTVDGKEVEWIVAPTYEGDVTMFNSTFSDGMCPIKVGNKHGYINDKGEVVVEPTLTGYAAAYKYGYVAAQNSDGKYGLLDKTGKWALEPIYDWVNSFIDNGTTVYAAAGYGEWSADNRGTFYDTNLNVIPEQPFPAPDADFVAIQKKYAGTDYSINRDFNKVGITILNKTADGVWNTAVAPSLAGVINRAGKVLVQPIYHSATICDDYVIVAEQMNYGNLNRMRHFVVDGSGKTVYEFYRGSSTFESDNTMDLDAYGDGLFVSKNEKVSGLSGYALPNGTIVIDPAFDIAMRFSEGYAWVQYQGKWGVIKNPIK